MLTFPALLAFGGAYDLLTMTIPNRVSIALVVFFFAAAIAFGLPTQAVLLHVATGMAVLTAGIALFAVGGFGGGDAKLLAGAGLWIGFEHLLPFLIYVTMFGGLLAVAILHFRKLPLTGTIATDWTIRLHDRSTGIPYGIAIASAALTVFPQTPLFLAAVG
ncbi:A24 family peptidase [Hyphomicrobium sp.]|uniref:A24 family peptidase n=1 Tax=Hyphomicrobium sp. TaxID=82 RepID=UPI003F6EBC71